MVVSVEHRVASGDEVGGDLAAGCGAGVLAVRHLREKNGDPPVERVQRRVLGRVGPHRPDDECRQQRPRAADHEVQQTLRQVGLAFR